MGSQAYNVILAGSYGVGKSTLFEHLSRREREGGVGKSCRAWDKWSHVMTIDGEQVQASCWRGTKSFLLRALRVTAYIRLVVCGAGRMK